MNTEGLLNSIYNLLVKIINFDFLKKISSKTIVVCSAIFGSIFIVINVILKFSKSGWHGDLVAQQLMVHQWSNGMEYLHATAEATSYVIKFPLYWLVQQLHLSINKETVLLTAILTLAGWLLSWFFISQIVKLFGQTEQKTKLLAILMFYVALISGYIFMINNPNSRNLEVGLALGVVYFILAILKGKFGPKKTILAALFSGLIFANDGLALFLIAVPFGGTLILYIIFASFKKYNFKKIKNYFSSLGFLIVSFISYAFFKTIIGLFISSPDKINNATIPNPEQFAISVGNLLFGIMHELGLDFFAKKLFSPETISNMVNWLIIIALGTVVYFYARHKKPIVNNGDKKIITLLFVAIMLACLIAMISGYLTIGLQLGMSGVERYLIYLPFLLIILILLIAGFIKKDIFAKIINTTFLLVIISAALFGFYSLRELKSSYVNKTWNIRKAHTYELEALAKKYDLSKGYGAFVDAQPLTYLSKQKTTMLPTACEKPSQDLNSDQKTELRIYDWLIETRSVYLPAKKSFIEVPLKATEASPCDLDVALAQFGKKGLIGQEITDEGRQVVLIYDYDILPKFKPQTVDSYKDK